MGSLAGWAVLYCDEMVLWLARLFAATELLTCAVLVVLLPAATGVHRCTTALDEQEGVGMMMMPGARGVGCAAEARAAAGLALGSALLLAALAGVPVTLQVQSSFLSFDRTAASAAGAPGPKGAMLL